MKTLKLAALMAVFAMPALADTDVTVTDAYARASGPTAQSGAAFMEIISPAEDDRLTGVSSDVAKRVELHTHKADANGMMQMLEIEDGIVLPAGEMHMLARGGDHVMLMGLNRPLLQGESFDLTLHFEKAGDVTVTVPVDNDRKPGAGGTKMKHDH